MVLQDYLITHVMHERHNVSTHKIEYIAKETTITSSQTLALRWQTIMQSTCLTAIIQQSQELST
ncbi:hypothetical protein SERLA73DRAFT_179604 [Serpula lacrymans var. lacrymans S7.3]|uniref:Uncharacterized protein n=2 Tax=Serpula lacrymans var. lacrymans TaxID=341189 RepID=F8PVU4_SERL3|nr:uncharacterized protein SERLADRAFT_464793 [Serpula lacrymans var. lacrymans S7.9]EGN99540.1 hypothetical protein SERLA73DRAFT_179604 [Serpula lacrymans var. lacrymans S7.3]EGO25109.1 hypothetical protein SERLADRAFT_464793 [Serpula lacrymans var. lacrymans S7.9]